jgi:NAD(P)-dependent dehydrogenase (short-subunit alcohol dehydrogenase family)
MTDLVGRVVVVTGATTGIGKETARELARKRAHVVVVGRDPAKIDETLRDVRATVPNASLSSARADFASLASVREAADAIAAAHERVHVLVNNAGAVYMERALTQDGLETTLQVNHLAPFLFTQRLLPALKAAGTRDRRARVVFVASIVHAQAAIDWDDLHTERGYTGLGAYAKAKLMNVMTTFALARRLDGAHVTSNCLHPGVIASGFGHNNRGWMGFGVKLVAPFLTTPAKGARTSIQLASAPDVERVTGAYFDEKGRQKPSSRGSQDAAAQERLWTISEELVLARTASSKRA